MHERWSKKQRRELHELRGMAWERELEQALGLLRSDFEMWKKGEISAFELSDRIHRFHDGRSRELFNMYTDTLDSWRPETAVAKGIIEDGGDETFLHQLLHCPATGTDRVEDNAFISLLTQ